LRAGRRNALDFVVDYLLPPPSLAVLVLLLLLFGGRRARLLAVGLTGVLVLLGMPLIGRGLLNSLAPGPPPPGPPPAAIVILSADAVQRDGPNDLGPGRLTLDRMRAGAALQRRTGLPVLVSGGHVEGSQMSLAGMMARSLRDDFRIPVRWEEGRSRDTWENAACSAAILKPAGITRVYLVTNFWHMRRALVAFRAAGLDPVAAPVREPYWPAFSPTDLLDRASAWYDSYLGVHEWIGLLYYSVRR
jgi:uncharacterized SAM-binding protein YcdF (DUF218 family)